MFIVMNEFLRIFECLYYYIFLRIWENRIVCRLCRYYVNFVCLGFMIEYFRILDIW